MGKSKKIETSYNFTAAKAAAYLRDLADRLDQGRIDVEQAEIDLSDHVEVKESIKRKPDKGTIKIKVKLSTLHPEPAPQPETETEQAEELVAGREADEEAPEQGPAASPADEAIRTPCDAPDRRSDPQPEPVTAPVSGPIGEPKRPPYKRLKKSMSENYKAIKTALRQGVAPDRALIEEFEGQCRRMATYPDKGEPYYGDFIEATDRLVAAFAGNDLPGMDAAVQEMGRLRKNCHRRFK